MREVVHSRIMAKEQEVASAERLAAEGRIASVESAVAEPGIEAHESSVEELGKVPGESAAAESDSGEVGCPILMSVDELRCGRKLHIAPNGVDEEPVCLMHSKDPNKQSGPLFDAFWLEFERILKDAGEGEAHFERFVFPQLDFRERNFKAVFRFDRATFTQEADFRSATFAHLANFWNATFTQNADFFAATFMKDVNFAHAIFTQNANFSYATFTQYANFYDATFTQDANFSRAVFTQDAEFGVATFTKDAEFVSTTFTKNAEFFRAAFTENADFRQATLTQAAGFVYTEFHGMVNWRRSRFLDRADFRHTRFELKIAGHPSVMFARSNFTKPGEVVFDDVDLSRALFHNCDVSQVWFTSSVRWGKRENNRGLTIFEETIDLNQEFAKGLEKKGQRDYWAVAQIYQQLKKSYDSRLDYWTANEFHFGEMEMKRLAVPTDGPLLWLRRWWHRNLSFVAWYKYASDYGNSYGKPLAWLVGVLLAAALLFPIPGLELKQAGSGNAASSASVTYSSVWNRQDGWTNKFWAEAKLIGKSGITAIDTATFQRTPEYAPAYPWGRVVAIFETLLTSSLFALFLLAIRRQFRR